MNTKQMLLPEISARGRAAVKDAAASKRRAYDLAQRMVASPGDIRSPQRLDGGSGRANCPICGAAFIVHGRRQETCGKPKCSRLWTSRKPLLCECERGFRIKKDRGCAQCEAESERFYESEKEMRQRVATAERKEARERFGMTRFSHDWNREHREFQPKFNAMMSEAA